MGSERVAHAPELVSIVTPVHNAGRFLSDTHRSVVAQDHQHWEWLLVDDCSSDGSGELIEGWTRSDARIQLLTCPVNVGAGEARNKALQAARGRFVAFLDADDVWEPDKLSRQLSFMAATDAYFSYTGFRYMPESGIAGGAVATPPRRMRYRDALKNTTILTSTVMLDTHRVLPEDLRFPDVRRGQDTALWWRLLRSRGDAHGLQANLTRYRQNVGSLSSNRRKALQRTWLLYRKQEQFPVPVAAWYFSHYVANALLRRRGRVSVGSAR